MIKTWQEREFERHGYIAFSPESNVVYMKAEIDELRKELADTKWFEALKTDYYKLKAEHEALKAVNAELREALNYDKSVAKLAFAASGAEEKTE
jgi:hypothetical protein